MKRLVYCNICGKLPAETKTKRLVIDHNHTTNIIRGWLCDFCNGKLGIFESTKDRSIHIIEERFKPSYIHWLAVYKERIYEHLNSRTGFKYTNRKFYRKLFQSAFA